MSAAPPERPSPALRGRAPHWRDRALCALPMFDANDWFPPRGPDPGRKAKAVCAACPVAAECLGYALEHGIREGIWGGLGEGDRRHLSRPGQVDRLWRTCRSGLHEMTAENTYTYPNGWKTCRACKDDRHQERLEQQREGRAA